MQAICFPVFNGACACARVVVASRACSCSGACSYKWPFRSKHTHKKTTRNEPNIPSSQPLLVSSEANQLNALFVICERYNIRSIYLFYSNVHLRRRHLCTYRILRIIIHRKYFRIGRTHQANTAYVQIQTRTRTYNSDKHTLRTHKIQHKDTDRGHDRERARATNLSVFAPVYFIIVVVVVADGGSVFVFAFCARCSFRRSPLDRLQQSADFHWPQSAQNAGRVAEGRHTTESGKRIPGPRQISPILHRASVAAKLSHLSHKCTSVRS